MAIQLDVEILRVNASHFSPVYPQHGSLTSLELRSGPLRTCTLLTNSKHKNARSRAPFSPNSTAKSATQSSRKLRGSKHRILQSKSNQSAKSKTRPPHLRDELLAEPRR